MSFGKIRSSRLLGAFAALALLASASAAHAVSLTIDSSLSSLTFGIDLYTQDEEPAYITSAIAQGDFAGTLPPGNGTSIPGYSKGLSAQANGSVTITLGPGTISVDGASVGLLNSGSWQPGTTPGNASDPPVPAQLGAYIDLDALFNGGPGFDTLTAAFTAMIFDTLTSGAVALGGGGVFSDPSGTFSLSSGVLNGFAAVQTLGGSGPFSTPLPATLAAATVGGVYAGGVLTLPILAVVNVDLLEQTGLPLTAQITVSGTLITTAVPEPSSIALLSMGAVAMGFFSLRRRKK